MTYSAIKKNKESPDSKLRRCHNQDSGKAKRLETGPDGGRYGNTGFWGVIHGQVSVFVTSLPTQRTGFDVSRI